jgi:hypothetical protein
MLEHRAFATGTGAPRAMLVFYSFFAIWLE